jgi:hypothetical protein
MSGNKTQYFLLGERTYPFLKLLKTKNLISLIYLHTVHTFFVSTNLGYTCTRNSILNIVKESLLDYTLTAYKGYLS